MLGEHDGSAEPWRGLEVSMDEDGIEAAIAAQLETGLLGLHEAADWLRKPDPRHFATTGDLWHEVLSQDVRAGRRIVVHDVLLTEWFPQSPGLYHSPWAADARREASRESYDEMLLHKYFGREPSRGDVYLPSVKRSMIRGGVGCVRLDVRYTPHGDLWFMAATSGRTVDEGFPVALSTDVYDRCIDRIVADGALACTLVGELMPLPPDLREVYEDFPGVQRRYLRVEEIRPAKADMAGQMSNLVAHAVVMMELTADHEVMAGAYASFSPAKAGSVENAVEFLEAYVEKLHAGTIVTDFDEQVARFPEAVFSLEKVAKGIVDRRRVEQLQERHFPGDQGYRRPPLELLDVCTRMQVALTVNAAHVNVGVQEMHGDIFSNIGAGAVVVNRSTLQDALNTTQASSDQAITQALQALADFIQTGNLGPEGEAAVESFNGLTEELAKKEPSKHRVKIWLQGLTTALPDVAQVAEAVAKIAGFWH